MKKSRILLAIDGLEFGGGERVFLQLASGLKNRFEIFAAAALGDDFEKGIRNLGLTFAPLDMSGRFSFKPVAELRRIIRSNHIDLIHSQGARADFFVRLAGLITRNSRVVNTITMPVEGFDVTPLRRKFYRIFDRLTEHVVSKFIVVSDSLENLLVENRGISRQKVVKIYNGIELSRYRPSTGDSHGNHATGSPAIGAVGRLVWQKGFEHLVRAMPDIIERFPEATLTFIGDGVLRKDLHALSEQLNIEKHVVFAGYRSDVATVLPAFDMVVVPSVKEGFPMVTLETMAMAKPIIATRIPGIIEQISDGTEGILIPPKDPAAIAKAVGELCENPKLGRELGERARKKVETCFSVENMTGQTENVYASLLNTCPYCGAVSARRHFRVGTRTFHRCASCDLIFKPDRTSYENLIRFYKNSYTGNYSADQLAGHRKMVYRGILERIDKKTAIGKLFDVGAGCGYFLCEAKKRGWTVKGVEPSVQSVETARNVNGLELFNGPLKAYPGRELFDAVTFLNVLEHSAEPWNEIKKAVTLLKPGGLICLRFPNGDLHTRTYRLAKTVGFSKMIGKFLVFHEFPLTSKYVKRLLSDCGFGGIDVYNSPLSEGDPNRLFSHPGFAGIMKQTIYAVAEGLSSATGGRILCGPSLEATAVRMR